MSTESHSHTSSKSFCHTCLDKNSHGVFKCEGCEKKFCLRHTNEHRNMLGEQLVELLFEQELYRTQFSDKRMFSTALLDQIDQWEKQAIERIQQTAKNLRVQVDELARQQTDTTRIKLDLFKDELVKAREANQYLETDLYRWKMLLEQLKCDYSILSSSITLEEDRDRTLVYSPSLTKHPYQSLIHESLVSDSPAIHFDEYRHLAMHCGPERGPAYISGTREYQTGRHQIRFLMTKATHDFIIAFNIASALMPLPSTAESESSWATFGWQSNDCVNPSFLTAANEKNRADLKLHRHLLIQLVLDCDRQKITYYNERTKERREMLIDLEKCPLPWKLYFYLYNVGDHIRLLSANSSS